MVLVQLDHVSMSFGANDVLVDVSWQIKDGARVGLIGPNGCGKTTLARIITGEYAASGGAVSRVKGIRTGYLEQEASVPSDHTARSYVLEADRILVELHEQMTGLERKIADETASDGEFARYGAMRDEYAHRGGYRYESRCEMVLHRLGFGERDYDRPVEVLSGGQSSRLALAALLVREPDLLVLDEPTNHLDIEATEWLEGFLASYPGAVVMISHDRVFLDRVVAEIVEIEDHRLRTYTGNYTAYTRQKAERRAQQDKAYELQRQLIERTEEFIRRNIAGQKTKQAQARRKQLEKTERLAPPSRKRSVRLSFVASHRGANEVVEVRHLSKSFGSLSLFDDLSFLVRRGDRVGVTGPNGSGKTTLLRMLVGDIEPEVGSIRFGVGIEAGYFDQRREGLEETNAVIDEVWSVKPSLTVEEIRAYLGSFLFSEDEQFRIVGTLSGGEQSRVALAKLVLGEVNLLIVDEPTNHLDIPSRVALEDALERFDGTLIVVSHDRAFLRRLTTRVVRLEGGRAHVFDMGYRAYEVRMAQERARQAELTVPAEDEPSSVSRAVAAEGAGTSARDKTARVAAYERKKAQERKRRRRERRFAEIEGRIMSLENHLVELDEQLGAPENAADWERLRDLAQERKTTKHKLDALYEEWATMERSSSAGLGEERLRR